MSANPDSVAQQGEFRSRVPPAKPMMTDGHKPGVMVGNEAVPEFHAQTYPAGTAPKEHTYQPNPVSETPGQALNSDMDESTRTGAHDFPGATSGDIHNEAQWGKPLQGQTGRELHGAHAGKRKKEHTGLEGVGASSRDGTVEGTARDMAADRDEAPRGTKGMSGSLEGGVDWQGAEEIPPVRAEELAAERD